MHSERAAFVFSKPTYHFDADVKTAEKYRAFKKSSLGKEVHIFGKFLVPRVFPRRATASAVLLPEIN